MHMGWVRDRAWYLKSWKPAGLGVIVSFSLAGDEVAWADRFLDGPWVGPNHTAPACFPHGGT